MKIEIAKNLFSKLKGLIGKQSIEPDYVLVLPGTRQVHGFFMRFALDVIFVDKNLKVIAIEKLKPWGISGYYRRARFVCECTEGESGRLGFKVGESVPALFGQEWL